MIYIIFGIPGTGKTCFLTHMAVTTAFDRGRWRSMQSEIMNKKLSGFDNLKTIPNNCVSANFDLTMRKFGYTPRHNRRINPYRLGFANKYVDTHFNLPYEAIFVTEAQKYLDSHLAMYFPRWQSSWYEQHRHNDIDIWLDTQRPMLINANVREISQFIEIVNLDVDYDIFGKPCRLTWNIRRIPNSSMYDKYMSSGQKDSSCYIDDVVVANYNVFDCYDSQSCKPKFYDGHFKDDFDYDQVELTDDSLEGYIKYVKAYDDEMPDNYLIKRGKSA